MNRLNIFSALIVSVFCVAVSSITLLIKYDLYCYKLSIVSSTIGLLWNKVRDSTAAKLQDGDITDAKIREIAIVVRDLNDIKMKLDALSRKDLLRSYSFLREGVELLNVCLDQSTHSRKTTMVNHQQCQAMWHLQS